MLAYKEIDVNVSEEVAQKMVARNKKKSLSVHMRVIAAVTLATPTAAYVSTSTVAYAAPHTKVASNQSYFSNSYKNSLKDSGSISKKLKVNYTGEGKGMTVKAHVTSLPYVAHVLNDDEEIIETDENLNFQEKYAPTIVKAKIRTLPYTPHVLDMEEGI